MLVILINDLMDFAKMETMNLVFDNKYFDLSQLLKQANDTVKFQAKLNEIKMNIDYQVKIQDPKSMFFGFTTIPRQRPNFFKQVLGDQLRYMQVVMNLLTNAIKFTTKGQSILIRVILLEVKNLNSKSECSESIDGSEV